MGAAKVVRAMISNVPEILPLHPGHFVHIQPGFLGSLIIYPWKAHFFLLFIYSFLYFIIFSLQSRYGIISHKISSSQYFLSSLYMGTFLVREVFLCHSHCPFKYTSIFSLLSSPYFILKVHYFCTKWQTISSSFVIFHGQKTSFRRRPLSSLSPPRTTVGQGLFPQP